VRNQPETPWAVLQKSGKIYSNYHSGRGRPGPFPVYPLPLSFLQRISSISAFPLNAKIIFWGKPLHACKDTLLITLFLINVNYLLL
jgi:hypothetical protein